jgi:hypothetical protein
MCCCSVWRQVDPLGERTIGVLTKPDLIGPGNEDEVMAVLLNVRKPLQLGYTMLRNRTQKELAAGVSAKQAKALEQVTLHPNCSYAAVAWHIKLRAFGYTMCRSAGPRQYVTAHDRSRTPSALAASVTIANARLRRPRALALQTFFATHPHFKSCDPKLFGVANLTSRLTQLLVSRIQAELVPMKVRSLTVPHNYTA